jgi:GABA(A) receptor-associated protein
MNQFIKNHTFDVRKNESRKITLKYPTKIPIIVEKYNKCKLNDIDKKKYLVPKDMLMSQFIYVIRKRIKLTESQALFVMVNNQLASSNAQLADVYEKYCNEDGFLYITYTSENTFG